MKLCLRIIMVIVLCFPVYQLGAQKEIEGKKPKKVRVKTPKPEPEQPAVKKEKSPKKEKGAPAIQPKTAPPGTVRLNDSVYIDVNPVSNIDYREYVSFLSITYSKEVRDSMDRMPMWGVNYDEFRRFMRNSGNDREMLGRARIRLDQTLAWAQSLEEYLQSPTFNNNPVICLSYSQALQYAEWRTRIVMFRWAVESRDEKQRAKYYTKIRYRLPTPEEWDEAMEKYSQNVILNKAVFPHNIACTMPAVPQKRKSEFYYVPGNIAEMTGIEKLAVGISWRDQDTTADYTKRVEYFGPRDWLGFRCVCEIVEY